MKKLSKEYLKHSNDYEVKDIEVCLYIIATPIGNFDDISLRAIQLLNLVDILLCEDTRKTKKLLAYLNINRGNMISYNDNNAAQKRPYVLKQLLSNKSIGLVSDAGTPLISDPGYKLVQDCYLHKVKVTHVPGPSSVINGLILSGLPTNQFYFGGFVSSKKNSKIKQFTLTKFYPMTGIWFDTCLRLIDTLEIIFKIYGNRKISITRELTKIYEDVISSDLQNIRSLIYERELNNKPLKGEIVIIIDGYDQKNDVNIETLRINIKKKLQKFSLRDTVNETIDETNFPRKLIYNEAVKIKNFMKKNKKII
ncbi:MAG: 16S rRNA (cytidine(1402)-2'-O)-methyltransferase [Candidatus Puniceispirillales bacterium]